MTADMRLHPDDPTNGELLSHDPNHGCVPRALAIAARIDYATADEMCQLWGQKKATTGTYLPGMMDTLGYKSLDVQGLTLNALLKSGRVASGRFIARKSRHAFAIVDGVVSDHTAPFSHLTHLWRIE